MNTFEKLRKEHNYCDLKNLGEAILRYRRSFFFDSHHVASGDLQFVADAAWEMKDYYLANSLYRVYLQERTLPDVYPDTFDEYWQGKKEIDRRIAETNRILADPEREIYGKLFVEGKNEKDVDRVENLITRLMPAYADIQEKITVSLIDNKEEYLEFGNKYGVILGVWNHFVACGHYPVKPDGYLRLVIPTENVRSYPDDALLGLCAHELSHFYEYSVNHNHNISGKPLYVREHLTDLDVVSKGFAVQLLASRMVAENSLSVLSVDSLKNYIKLIDEDGLLLKMLA